MNSRKKRLKESYLYVILDRKVLGDRSLVSVARRIISCGVGIIQLRDKYSQRRKILEDALALGKLLRLANTLYIINDYLDIAQMLDCDGVHLGQDDIPVELARRLLGKDKLIGVSCSNLKEALAAETRGADYVGIGPCFPTPLKPNSLALEPKILRACLKKIKIPIFAIGGINQNNLSRILSYGLNRVAVSRAICRAEDIPRTIKEFRKLLKR